MTKKRESVDQSVAANLKKIAEEWKKKTGLGYSHIASRMGVTASAISGFINGHAAINAENLKAFSDILECSIWDINPRLEYARTEDEYALLSTYRDILALLPSKSQADFHSSLMNQLLMAKSGIEPDIKTPRLPYSLLLDSETHDDIRHIATLQNTNADTLVGKILADYATAFMRDLLHKKVEDMIEK